MKESGGESPYSFVAPLSKNLKYECISAGMNMSQVRMICSSGSMKNQCQQEDGGALKHQRVPIDLELPASYYASDSENPLPVINAQVSSNEVLKLSLRTDSDTWEKSSGKNTFKDDIICSPSQQSVCLEGSVHGGDFITFNSKSARRKLFTCHGIGELDLNKAAPDESSIYHLINCTSSGVSQNEICEYSKGTFLTLVDRREPKNNNHRQEDITKSTLPTSPSRSTESGISLTDKKMNFDSKKEDRHCSQYTNQQVLLEGTDSNRSPISCKSDWTPDDVSSNTKTRQCFIDVPKKVVHQNVVPSTEMRSQSCDPKKQDLAKVDVTVRKGAVSLMYFSSECLAGNQDYETQSKKRKGRCNIERVTSQSSSESYEAIVLKQKECSVDECCVSSTPFEVTSSDRKDYGVKLRRGRRMKDFRKEILPGLPSLSRHEICEDMKIMELAIRSRDYKKYGSKNARKSSCFPSVRSRSKLSYVGKRY